MHFFPQKKNKQMYNIGYLISLMFNIIFDKKFIHKILTRSDILQGQALFRGVKQLRRCLVMLRKKEK